MNILKRFAGPTAIGLFLAVIGLVLSIYTDYFRKQISLSMTIENEINVFSVNEKVQNLNIIFRGRNISMENLGLKFIKVKSRFVFKQNGFFYTINSKLLTHCRQVTVLH